MFSLCSFRKMKESDQLEKKIFPQIYDGDPLASRQMSYELSIMMFKLIAWFKLRSSVILLTNKASKL